jgi:replicative DNA helicase
MELTKVPPHNLEAEQAVLGSLMLDPEQASMAFEILRAEDLYRDSHKMVFTAIQEILDKGEPVDLITVAEYLRQHGRLESIGGIGTISQIASSVPSAANVEHYARIVAEKALLRQLIKMAGYLEEKG